MHLVRAALLGIALTTLALAGCLSQGGQPLTQPASVGGSATVPDVVAEGAEVIKGLDSVELIWQGEAGMYQPVPVGLPIGLPLPVGPGTVLTTVMPNLLDHGFSLPPEVTSVEATLTWANEAVNLNLQVRDEAGRNQCRSVSGVEGEPAKQHCKVYKVAAREEPLDWVARVTIAQNVEGPEPFELRLNLSVKPFPLLGPALAPAQRSPLVGFAPAVRVDEERRSGEPSLKVDGGENVYIAYPTGKMQSLFRTSDGGATFEYLDINAAATNPEGMVWGSDAPVGRGGGDSEVFVSEDGQELYFADLWGTCMTVGSSMDAGQSWMVNPFSCELPGTDRQWLWAQPGGHLWMTYNGASIGSAANAAMDMDYGGLLVMHSIDAGQSWLGRTHVPEDNCARGNLVVNAEGRWFVAGCNDAGPGVAASDGMGYTWTTVAERSGEPLAGFCYVCGIFTVIDIDTEGNLYVVWADPSQDEEGFDIWFSTSQDQAQTWSAPVMVNHADGNAVLPWVAAGAPGHAVVSWYQTAAKGNPDELDGEWYVHVAETTNGLDAAPAFAENLAWDTPVQFGPLCLTGSACQAARNLLDFLMVDIDHHGATHLAFIDGGHGGSAGNSYVMYARMTAGQALTAEEDEHAGM